jgi:hypothetical protein
LDWPHGLGVRSRRLLYVGLVRTDVWGVWGGRLLYFVLPSEKNFRVQSGRTDRVRVYSIRWDERRARAVWIYLFTEAD